MAGPKKPVVEPGGWLARGPRSTSSWLSPSTSLVGREEEITQVSALLGEGRLVTLTGAGGAGKTRLALAVARGLAASDQRVAFLDLATLVSAEFVPAAILSSLGSRATAEQLPIDLAAELIGESSFLLVLDNFEHVIAAAPLVMDLLQRCPRLAVLVTSRRRLKLSIEHVFEVHPLAVPAPAESPEALVDFDSVRLFIARATESGGTVDKRDLPVVAEICRRLEGLPLAIELAAAHARYLSVQALLGRLDEPLPLLAGGPIDAPARQRALRHSIAWSYELLDEKERTFFGRLGAFEGPFTLEGAHHVAGDELYESQTLTLEALAGLTDQGLLQAEPRDDAEARFRMHDAIRDFAQAVVDDGSAARDRMLGYYVGLAEQAEPELERADSARWTRILVSEMDNLRGALSWSYKSGSAEALLRLATALGNFWRWRGDLREGREWLSRAVLAALPGHESLLSKAQRRAARIYSALAERDQAMLLCNSARKNAEAALDVSGVAESLVSTASVVFDDGRPADAEALIDEALALARSVDDRTVLTTALLEKGVLEHYKGELANARALYEEVSETARSLGNLRLAGVAIVNSADTRIVERDYEAALQLATRGAAYLDACDDLAFAPWAHLLLGLAHRRLGSMDEARREIHIGATRALDAGTPVDVIFAGEAIADWLGAAGMCADALSCWAAATSARQDLDYPRQPWDDAWINEGIERDRSALSNEAAAAAWNDGSSVGIRETVSVGLGALDTAVVATKRSRRGGVRPNDRRALTPRESDVLKLLTKGLSDREIAEALSISPGTATAHVASIKWKLAAGSRVDIATSAIRTGLVEIPTEHH